MHIPWKQTAVAPDSSQPCNLCNDEPSASSPDGCLNGRSSLWETWAGLGGMSLQGSKAVVQEDVAVFPGQNTVV